MRETKSGAAGAVWSALGSMRLFFFLSLLIVLWMCVLIVIYPHYADAIQGMNNKVLLDWFLTGDDPTGDPIRGWLCGLCLIVFALGINLAVCVVDDFAALAGLSKNKSRPGNTMSRLSLMIIHISYIMVLLGHLASSTTGFRYSYEVKSGTDIAVAGTPFAIHVGDLEMEPDRKGGGMRASAVDLTLDGAGRNSEKMKMKIGKTVFMDGFLLAFYENRRMEREGKRTNVQFTPSLRVSRNPGLVFVVIGAGLFFIGMIMRMAFRPYRA